MKTVYVVGSANTDMVVKCDSLPKPGETVVGGRFFQVHGGKGANQAVAAARLQATTVFFCRLGDDAFGTQSLKAYQEEGIDTTYIIREAEGHSGIALIVVDEKGENYIAVASGVNANMVPQDVEPLSTIIQPGDILLLQLEIPLPVVEEASRIAKSRGARVILDPAPAPREPFPHSLLQTVDYLVPNIHEAQALVLGQREPDLIAQSLIQHGVRHVILTCGAEGCLWVNQEGVKPYPANAVKAMDTTAAGDAFAGALAVALAEGKEEAGSIEFAQKAAACSVTRMGAQSSLPTRRELDAFEV